MALGQDHLFLASLRPYLAFGNGSLPVCSSVDRERHVCHDSGYVHTPLPYRARVGSDERGLSSGFKIEEKRKGIGPRGLSWLGWLAQ